MPSEEFYKIMAGMGEREKRLYDNLAALEEEGRAVVRDHRELLVAIENDQGPTHSPQHPVAEALIAFRSTQFVGPPAMASGTGSQSVGNEDSLFVPEDPGESQPVNENAEESLFVPESAGDAHYSPQHAENLLFISEDARINEPIANRPPRLKRRVTFSDAPDTIFGALSSPANHGSGDVNIINETPHVQSPSGEAHTGFNEPANTGERRPIKRPRPSLGNPELMLNTVFAPPITQADHVNPTQEFLSLPATFEDTSRNFDDTNMSFNEPIHSAFAPTSPGDGNVSTAQESHASPITSVDTNMAFDQPIYTGNRRPVKRVRHSSRTPKLMHNTGFTPGFPDNKPASDAQNFGGTHNHQGLVDTYNAQNLAGTYDPQDFVATSTPENYLSDYDLNVPAGGPIEPWQEQQYTDMAAASKLPDYGDSHLVCPYPDCGKAYVNSLDVEQHLKHHHPDWSLIEDAAVASDSM